MHTKLRPLAALGSLLLLTACASGPRISSGARLVAGPSGMDVPVAEAAMDLADYDVVFLGEQHGNQPVHRTHLMLLQALAEQRGDIALSMEMFERDEQLSLSRYLAGEISEDELLELIEVWPRYERDYRPMVEFARMRGFPVLAANTPRSLVRRVGREGLAAVEGERYLPENIDLSRGEYFERFCGAMGMSTDAEGETAAMLDRLYTAQRMWDCSMAEAIVQHFEDEAGRLGRPLVVHVVGAFHVSGGLGTMQVLKSLRPDLRIAVVDVESVPNPEVDGLQVAGDGVANYVVVAPELPPQNVDSARVHGAPKDKVHGGGGGAPDDSVHKNVPREEMPEEAEVMVEEVPAAPGTTTSQPTSGPTSKPSGANTGGR